MEKVLSLLNGEIVEKEISVGFSVNYIIEGEVITIPERRQMRVYQEITIMGDLEIRGELIAKDV